MLLYLENRTKQKFLRIIIFNTGEVAEKVAVIVSSDIFIGSNPFKW